MANTVGSQTIQDGDKIAVMKFTNLSDGTAESALKKVDVSALNTRSGDSAACTRVAIQRIWFTTNGMTVQILWDATTDIAVWTLPNDGNGYHDFRSVGPLRNNAGSGITGDIMFTTVNHSAGDNYTVMLEMRKFY
jgi:hypothetical protein